MYKTNEGYGRRGSYVASSEKKAIESIFNEPYNSPKKYRYDSRNVNPISNIYGRRSESVTSALDRNHQRRITVHEEQANARTFHQHIYAVTLKSDAAFFHSKSKKVISKQNLNNIYNSGPFHMNRDSPKKIPYISVDKLKEDIKNKDNEIKSFKSIIKSVEDQLRPLNYSIESLKSFIKEYQELHQTQISMSKEIKTLKDKCTEAEQQLKFFESMEQNKHHRMRKKKEKLNTSRKSSFEKIEALLSNLNINLYQLNDVISCDEFLESVLSVKIQKEAEEIALRKNEKRNAVSHYSDKNSNKDGSDMEGSKQRIEIDEQTLEFLKKSAEEQVESIKNGYGEMRDCWKLYYSFMKSFLEIYAGDEDSDS